MKNGMILKASILLGVFVLVIGVALAFTLGNNDPDVPNITNGEDVYVTVDGLEITKQELWDVMKDAEGFKYLLDYIDEQILTDYLSNITQEEIDEQVLLATYGTSDSDTIAEIQEDAERNQQLVDDFDQKLTVNGFNPDDPADVRAYLELQIAKRNMARDYIDAAAPEDEYGVTETQIETYFNRTNYGDVCAINVHFSSSKELSLVLDHFSLVPNFNQGFGLYTGQDPIDEVASDDFDSDNTTQLSDEQVFQEMIKLYNYMNPWEDQLTEGTSMDNFCTNNTERFTYNFENIIEEFQTGSPSVQLANYLFNTLEVDDENSTRYSYSGQTFGNATVLSYKVSAEDAEDWDSLTDTEVEELRAEVIEEDLTGETINAIMQEKRDEFDLEVLDPELALRYKQELGVTFENDGSETVVATFDGTDITADILYDYMEETVGTYYSLESIKLKRIVESDEYEDVYGESRKYMDNNSDRMKEHREELRSLKTRFSANEFAQLGFASANYTWNEFLYLAFGAMDENEVLERVFVLRTLQPEFVDPDYTLASDYAEKMYNEYFSLQAVHLLLYVDYDKDFTPDAFHDLVDSLTPAEMDEYNLLKVAFEDLVYEKFLDLYDFAAIVDEYQDSLMNDPDNEWAVFKQYGFQIMSETLSVPGQQQGQTNPNLNNKNTTSYDEDFVAALKRIYDEYVLPANEDKSALLDTQLTVTDFGIHLIEASKGTGFQQPTAEYEIADGNPDGYTDAVENDTDLPSTEQLNLYQQVKYASLQGEETDVLIPESVVNACEEYYGRIFLSYYSQTGFSISTTEFILDNNVQYAENNADVITFLEETLEILYEANFPEEFNNPVSDDN